MYRVLVGKPKGRRPLGRPRRRWVDNNRIDLQELGCYKRRNIFLVSIATVSSSSKILFQGVV